MITAELDHYVVIASPKGVPARRSAVSHSLASKSYGTQAWQSRIGSDCFVAALLAMTRCLMPLY